ncbi:DUF421 domain-containing protein [Vallitalea guaymasensis]|uniref:DUF421 domain-containing protein n=1 Tax=Vallitalea guaymasensis TaxID=1185412 RepID=A0A8J8SAR0_9FIRM|nr:YetF domain-containing protein [Vallitalea guaymasensis]QUH27625.1 DUF421 domain-containing protein [Vallitalea guaymasensis]
MPFLLKPIVLYVVAIVLLRITGRRSLAQMTIAQTVMVISIGAIIVEPFADKDIIKTIIAASIYIVLLLLFEYLEFHFHFFEKIAVGREVIIIENGSFIPANLKKLKLTKAEIMTRVRQEGIPNLNYIEKGTLEPNGQFGFILKRGAEPIRVQDMEYLLNTILLKQHLIDKPINLVDELKKQQI